MPSAAWYEVEVSNTGEAWTKLGRANISQMTVSVEPGIVFARVRAARDDMSSGWAIWNGDTTTAIPIAPTLQINGVYAGGYASITWDSVANAVQYAVALKKDGQSLYTTRVESSEFEITPEIQSHGPFRNLECSVSSIGETGTSENAVIELSDPAPDAPESADIVIHETSVTLESVIPDESEDKAGYVLLRGETADFEMNQVVEMRQTDALPYIWTGLEPGTYFFRVAVKDAFFEIVKNPLDLNWSPVLTVDIGDNGNG